VNPRKASGRDRDAPEHVDLDPAAKNMPPGTPEADTSRGRDASRVLAMRNGVNLMSPVAGDTSKKDEEADAALAQDAQIYTLEIYIAFKNIVINNI
jgi:hypothetical protein